MISVPNPLRPLNGSKLLLTALSLTLLLGSCDLFKKLPPEEKPLKTDEEIGDIQGPGRVNPETGQFEPVRMLTEPLDTVRWITNSEDQFRPILSDAPFRKSETAKPSGDAGTVYKIAYMLPFMSDRFFPSDAAIGEQSMWAIHYYGGVRLALEQLEREGARFQVSVLDSKGSETEITRMINGSKAVQEADLLIGPYRSINARLLADFARRARKPMVSPFSAGSNITVDNPYYIQVNPGLLRHCEELTLHASERYTTDQLVLVARNQDEEKARLTLFQDAHQSFKMARGLKDTTRIRELIVTDQSIDLANLKLNSYLNPERRTVFIVPSYSDEAFIYAFLRKLKLSQSGTAEVSVYGMPQWGGFDKIDYDLYEDLNVHISSAFYIDIYDADVQNFRKNFFNLYGTIPNDEAYSGYDQTLYFGRLLMREGPVFLQTLDTRNGTGMSSQFEFRKITDRPVSGNDQFSRFDRFENQFVHILVFRDYYFQPAR